MTPLRSDRAHSVLVGGATIIATQRSIVHLSALLTGTQPSRLRGLIHPCYQASIPGWLTSRHGVLQSAEFCQLEVVQQKGGPLLYEIHLDDEPRA